MAIQSKETLSEEFIGTITNNSDPDKCGRCKVRVFNIMDEIPDDMLPWATPIGQNMVFATKGAGAISIPKVGHIVRVRFVNGNIYCPEYWAIQHLDTDLINEIKDDYLGTHVLLYDSSQELSVIFQPNSGIRIYYRGSRFQITPDNMITICHAENTSVIQLQGSVINIFADNEVNVVGNNTVNLKGKVVNINGTESVNISGDSKGEKAVNGIALMTLLESLATIIDQKISVSPGLAAGIVNSSKPSILNSRINYV